MASIEYNTIEYNRIEKKPFIVIVQKSITVKLEFCLKAQGFITNQAGGTQNTSSPTGFSFTKKLIWGNLINQTVSS